MKTIDLKEVKGSILSSKITLVPVKRLRIFWFNNERMGFYCINKGSEAVNFSEKQRCRKISVN